MALINLTVDLTNPALPKVVSSDVLNVFPGDRLEFVSKPAGTEIAVKLGNTLLALVKNAGLNLTPGDFVVTFAAPGPAIIELVEPGGGQASPPDPPS
jgi:hypothetical protein